MSILCKYCNEFKLETDFLPSQLKIKSPKCKECVKEYKKQYRIEHKEEIKENNKQWRSENKEKIKEYNKQYSSKYKEEKREYMKQYISKHKEEKIEYNKQYYIENKDKIKEDNKQYRTEHKEEKREYNKQYNTENKDKRKEYQKNRKKTDPVFKLRINVSISVHNALLRNGSSKNSSSILKHLPYTIEELKNYIELLFEPWMTWENHGKYNVKTWDEKDRSTWAWHLDHIIPQTHLSYTSMEDDNFKICWALENLRPYNAKNNIEERNNRSQEEIVNIKSNIKERLEKLKILKGKE